MSMKPVPWVGPWKGVITDLPSGFDPQAWDQGQNWLFREGRLQERPGLVQYPNLAPDGRSILNLYSYQDALSNWHTLAITDTSVYALTIVAGNLAFNAMSMPSGMTDLGAVTRPFALIEMNQQVYFSNGAQPLLFVDGSANVQIAGDVPGGCRFLTENSNHLIGVYWTIPPVGVSGSTTFPFYVVYSNAGNPQSWTPGLSTSAGIINLIEKGGAPTGVTTLGAYTYVWRQFGANVLWPTGNASAPFYNEPFSWSNPGWGNFYPYSITTWNNKAYLVTHNGEVLAFAGAQGASEDAFEPLAEGKVKGAIAADLAHATGTVFGFCTDQLGLGYHFESYVLWIPGQRAWVYNIADKNWSWFTSQNRFATAFGNIKVQ